jgi:hypothetical protein
LLTLSRALRQSKLPNSEPMTIFRPLLIHRNAQSGPAVVDLCFSHSHRMT